MTAVGFAIDIEAIAHAQSSLGIQVRDNSRGVLIAPSPDRRNDAASIASALRVAGLRAAVDLGGARRGDLIDYARSVGFAQVLQIRADSAEITGGADVGDAVAKAAAGDVTELVRALEGESQ